VVKHDKKGYGIAYLEGFKTVKGKYVFCADADGTYDFNEIPRFLHYLRQGYDFVIGNRFKGKMNKEAMPFSHRYIGNPFLSMILRLFFKAKVGDSHCGMRALTKEAIDKLELKTTGMEFASEMIIKAAKNKLKIKELAIDYHKRIGKSKLSSFTDGWRHLRFMLMYAPDYLFMIPGMLLLLFGIFIMGLFLIGPVEINGLVLYTHPMIVGSFLSILGYQIITLGIYAKTYAVSIGFEKNDKFIDFLAKLITFESGLILGFLVLVVSFIFGSILLLDWVVKGFPGVLKTNDMILILTLAILGVQTMFSAFFLSILLVKKRN
jgi:glycosyltransferase involved in cell wall biosynthesis